MVVDGESTSPGREDGNGSTSEGSVSAAAAAASGGGPGAAAAASGGSSNRGHPAVTAAPSSPPLKESTDNGTRDKAVERMPSPAASMSSSSPPQPPPSRRRSGSGGGTPHVSQRLGSSAPTSPFSPTSTSSSPVNIHDNHHHDSEEAFRLSSSPLPQLVLPPSDHQQEEEQEEEEEEEEGKEEGDEEETAVEIPARVFTEENEEDNGSDGGDDDDEEDNSEVEEEDNSEEDNSEDEEDTETETETEADDMAARMVDPRRRSQGALLESPSINLGGRLMWRDEQHGVVESPMLPGLDSMGGAGGLRLRRPQQNGGIVGSSSTTAFARPAAINQAFAAASSSSSSPPRTPQNLAGAQVVQMDEAAREAWVCSVCLQNFDEPFALPHCAHTFCRGCIQGIVRNINQQEQQQSPPQQPNPHSPKTPHCPLCRLEFIPSEVKPNQFLYQEMRDARIRCPNPRCGAIFSPLQTKRHQDECPYGVAVCLHQPHGCTFSAPRKDMPAHLALCPYEQIKGLFPKIRQSNEHVTAAMRGWENAFLSQQQMLASHTALLRTLDRRSHHNPWHHLQLVGTLFWEPYLWLPQRERWTRTFSPFVTAMLAYLFPVLLALLRVATRGNPNEGGGRLFYSPSHTYPAPIIGANCFFPSIEDGNVFTETCVAGLAPQLAWLALVLVVGLAFIEGHDEDKWLVWGQLRLCPASTTPSLVPTPSSSSSSPLPPPPPAPLGSGEVAAASSTTTAATTATTTTTTTTTAPTPPPSSSSSLLPLQLSIPLPVGHMLLEFCTAWACYALGGGRGRLVPGKTVGWRQLLRSGWGLGGLGGAALVRYVALGLSLIPALAIQSIAPRCKFQKPVLQGLVLGLCMYLVEWRGLAGSILLEAFLSHGFGYLFGEHFLQTFRARAVPVGPRYSEFLRRHSEQQGAPFLGVFLFGLAAGMLFFGARRALIQGLVLQNLLQSVAYTCLILLDRFMQRAQRMPRPPNWSSATAAQQQQHQDPRRYAVLMATRALLVTSLVGTTMLAFF